MKIFGTGASGFIGSAVTGELIRLGHQLIGLVRSDRSAEALAKTGATPLDWQPTHPGLLDHLDHGHFFDMP